MQVLRHQGGSPTTRLTLRHASNLTRRQQTLLVKSPKGRSGPKEQETRLTLDEHDDDDDDDDDDERDN